MSAPPRTAEIRNTSQGQAVILPDEFRFESEWVGVRREGKALILEPIAPEKRLPARWPEGFFESIRINDPAFGRPDQGVLPPIPSL